MEIPVCPREITTMATINGVIEFEEATGAEIARRSGDVFTPFLLEGWLGCKSSISWLME